MRQYEEPDINYILMEHFNIPFDEYYNSCEILFEIYVSEYGIISSNSIEEFNEEVLKLDKHYVEVLYSGIYEFIMDDSIDLSSDDLPLGDMSLYLDTLKNYIEMYIKEKKIENVYKRMD